MPTCILLPALGASRGVKVVCYGNKKGSDRQEKEKSTGKLEKTNGSVETQSQSAPRIVDTRFASLRKQLRFVKSLKTAEERESKDFAPAPRSKFRRKRDATQNASPPKQEESAELAREEELLQKGRGITSLYNTSAMTDPPAVLVDGYNVLLRWLKEAGEEVRKNRVRGDLEACRLEILRDLSDYSGWRRLRMMVAFDAQGNPDASNIARDQVGGVEVVFVGLGEADSFIIGEAKQLRKSGCPYVLVASSDNDIRDACWTNEIFPIGAVELLKEIRKAKKEADKFYKESLSKMRSDRIGYSLMKSNPRAFHRLEKARRKAMRK